MDGHKLKYLTGPMRVPFLILTPACVLLGLATADWSSSTIHPLYGVVTLIGAMAAHISVNAFNEFFDFKSGLDFRTRRTPFSGGSGEAECGDQYRHAGSNGHRAFSRISSSGCPSGPPDIITDAEFSLDPDCVIR
ncbi:MAG: hypothetical protein ACQEQ7_03115 [Thermodesulfobacteriota bacterium]